MKFEINMRYLDDDGEELTSSREYVYADSESEAQAKAELLLDNSSADDYSIERSY